MHPIPLGSYISYRRGWSTNRTYRSHIKSVELSDTDEFVYILEDGHWCYAGQIAMIFSNEEMAQPVHVYW